LGEENDVERQRLNWPLESLFFFALLVCRFKQGAWHKRIQLMKGSDFPSTRTTNSFRLILSLQHSIGNPCNTFTRRALRESHQTSPSALRAETSSRSQHDPPDNQIWHTYDSCLSQKEKVIFFLCRSSFLEWVQQLMVLDMGFGDKSILFLPFQQKVRPGQLGLLSINFDFRNVIFQPMVFPFVWAKYKWKFMRDCCKLSFLWPLVASPLPCAFSLCSPK